MTVTCAESRLTLECAQKLFFALKGTPITPIAEQREPGYISNNFEKKTSHFIKGRETLRYAILTKHHVFYFICTMLINKLVKDSCCSNIAYLRLKLFY